MSLNKTAICNSAALILQGVVEPSGGLLCLDDAVSVIACLSEVLGFVLHDISLRASLAIVDWVKESLWVLFKCPYRACARATNFQFLVFTVKMSTICTKERSQKLFCSVEGDFLFLFWMHITSVAVSLFSQLSSVLR